MNLVTHWNRSCAPSLRALVGRTGRGASPAQSPDRPRVHRGGAQRVDLEHQRLLLRFHPEAV